MTTPARWGELGNPASAPDDGPRGYLHHSDGTWSFLGADGWPVSPAEFDVDTTSPAVAPLYVIGLDPIDTETTEP